MILGGGPFFPGVYVTVRMIRHFGCQLPIEVWHHGSREPVVPHWLEPFGVRFVDTDRHMDANPEPPRLRGGWASKLYVMLHSSFEVILHLDSDCYPVDDVTPLFDLNTVGSILWPNPSYCDPMIHWFAYPTEPSGQPPVNSGVMLLDKARCWKTLVLAQWWNDHADYVYKHGCGDQDVVRGVWQYQRERWHRFADAPARFDGVHVDLGPQGTPLFVHRINDKFRLPCMPICSSAQDKPTLYKPEPVRGNPHYDATLPQEEVAFQAFHQFLWLLDHDPARFRPGTLDQFNWQETASINTYKLPTELPPDSRVIDVEAHIGSFTHLAMRRGAGRVWAFEVDPDNFAQCEKHVALWGPRVLLRNQAVWHTRGRAGYLPNSENNGAGRVLANGESVETVAIDDVLDEVSEDGTYPIHLLKLDCEGSEWPILFSSRLLTPVRQHRRRVPPRRMAGEGGWPDDLYRLLDSQGFTVTIRPFSDRQGLFWATRIDAVNGTAHRRERTARGLPAASAEARTSSPIAQAAARRHSP